MTVKFWGGRIFSLVFDDFPVMILKSLQIMFMNAADNPNTEEFPEGPMKFLSALLPASAVVNLLFFGLTVPPSFAMNASEKAQLEKLDPMTRLEQRCDVEAMERIAREHGKFSVDKVLAYAFSDPVTKKNSIKADGAAFRSGERWYKLSFVCKTDAEHINIVSFHYDIGDEVPHDQWDKHYLVP